MVCFHLMSATREKEADIRAILEKEGFGEVPLEALIVAEKGVYKGFLALAPGRAFFLSDRFGRLVFDGEFPYDLARKPETRKAIFGWEFQARFGTQTVRFSRLDESDAREIASRTQ